MFSETTALQLQNTACKHCYLALLSLFLSRILSINEWTNCLRMYKRLLTNCLHGKAAELYLANS